MPKPRGKVPQKMAALQIGEPFNPFRFFNGIFVPEALVRTKLVSAGAKLAYGRLVRYAGALLMPQDHPVLSAE